MNFEPGTILCGKYRVDGVLGRGGMGIVLSGEHIQLQQRVAIKVMLPGTGASDEAVTRFLREARAAAKISSEHVARVFDVGSLETGEPYMAMEFLNGTDVAVQLEQRGRLPAEEAVGYLLQACEALAEAHRVGIIHRDLKPANLFLVQRIDGSTSVKVLDFGISKMTSASGTSDGAFTRTSALMGSPLYMSPEQMESSRSVDARSDIWALGAVLYEMVTGVTPFNAETLPQVCAMVMSANPVPASQHVSDLSPELDAVIMRCLAKRPEQRFANVAAFAQSLLAHAPPGGRQSVQRISMVLGAEMQAEPALVADPVPARSHAQTTASWGDTKPPLAKKKSSLGMLAALVGVAGLAGGGVWLTMRPAASDAVATAPSSGVDALPVTAEAAPEPSPSAAPEPQIVPVSEAEASAVADPADLEPPPAALPARPVRPATPPRPKSARASSSPVPKPPPAPDATPKPAVPKPAGVGGRSRL